MNPCFISCIFYIEKNQTRFLNNVGNLARDIKKIFKACEIVLVFDESIAISNVMKDGFLSNQVVVAVQLSGKNSLNDALAAGRDISSGDYVFEFETLNFDLPYEEIESLYKTSIREGIDIVELQEKKRNSVLDVIRNIIYAHIRKGYKFGSTPVRIISRRAINRIKDMFDWGIHRKLCYILCGLPITKIFFDAKQRDIERPFEISYLSAFLFTMLPQTLYTVICAIIGCVLLVSYNRMHELIVSIAAFSWILGELILLITKAFVYREYIKTQYAYREVRFFHK